MRTVLFTCSDDDVAPFFSSAAWSIAPLVLSFDDHNNYNFTESALRTKNEEETIGFVRNLLEVGPPFTTWES